VIIDCIADLHGFYPKLEGGDLLIVVGDLTANDNNYDEFYDWLDAQPYECKIVIAGNHDNGLEGDLIDCQTNCHYLQDSIVGYEGIKIWGSPWTKTFSGMNPECKAFTVDTDEELAEKWALIPDDTDILITHSPAWGTHDKVMRSDSEEHCGSRSLVTWIANHVNTLKLHVCGHIHEGYGVYDIRKSQNRLGDQMTPVFVNASHVNERYQPVNAPIRVIL
jgi:Icc-related predicted phosphoesterase